ncbi:MAG: CopD family protein [Thiotrichales bacterium]
MAWLIAFHVLGTVVWIGGMFFAHMALRPAAASVLDAPNRLRLMQKTLGTFFLWVWASIIALWISGFGIIGLFGGMKGLGIHVHSMMGIALLMTAIFAYLYFVPFLALRKTVREENWNTAGKRLALIRQLVATNLVLGLITTIIGAAGRYVGG